MCLDTDLYGKDSTKVRHVKEKRFFSASLHVRVQPSYEKIVQKSDMSKKKDFFLLRCMSECSLSYEKIVQKSDMSKKKDMISYHLEIASQDKDIKCLPGC